MKTTIAVRAKFVDGEFVPATTTDRWVCSHSHPHPTSVGADACDAARADGATDDELLALFDAEVAAFNA